MQTDFSDKGKKLMVFPLKEYFCHWDGDNYYENLSPKQKAFIDDIDEYEEVEGLGGGVIGLRCRMKNGQRFLIELFKQNAEGGLLPIRGYFSLTKL
jgi:hypothetical protein